MRLKNRINQKIFNLKTRQSDKFYILSDLQKEKSSGVDSTILLNRALLKTNFNIFNQQFMKNNVRYEAKDDKSFDLKSPFIYARFENYHFLKQNLSSNFCLQQVGAVTQLLKTLKFLVFFRFNGLDSSVKK